jgi:DNA-binding transcriptional LysR family regulator
LGSKHALLLAGIGWGNMPEPMVHDDLAAGRLKRLDLPEWSGAFLALQAIHRTDTPPRPAAAWMIRRFSQQAERGRTQAEPRKNAERRRDGQSTGTQPS